MLEFVPGNGTSTKGVGCLTSLSARAGKLTDVQKYSTLGSLVI